MKRAILKGLKVISISTSLLLLALFLLPFLFPGAVTTKVKAWANNSITGDLNFSKARLSFFNHFPSLTLTLYDVSLKGAAPFSNDTLVAAKEVALGVNLATLFSNAVGIDEIYLTEGDVHVLVDSAGHPNYNVYESSPSTSATPADSGSASLKIARIQLEHCNIIYDDRSLPMYIRALDLNYTGKGDLTKAQFDLHSDINIGAFDLSYGGTPYITSKKLNGNLVTKINTNSLDFIFERNDIRINELPVAFKGAFGFLKNGYKMDFSLQAKQSALQNFFSALPPEYVTWLQETKVQGIADLDATLAGEYIAETNAMPGITFNLNVRNGLIAHAQEPVPVSNLYLNFRSSMPQLNTDSLRIHIDSVFFNLDKDYFSAVLRSTGLTTPNIYAKLNTDLDLEKWSSAVGLQSAELKGRLQARLQADGRYATGIVYKGLRQKADTVVTSIPVFTLAATLRNGYFKFAGMPQGLKDIRFDVQASCPDSNYAHTQFNISDINASLLSNYIKGFLRLKNFSAPQVDAQLESVLHLADLQQFYKTDSLDVQGDLNIAISSKGSYVPAKRLFPVTTATLTMNNGELRTPYYPKPLQKINIDARITNTTGTLRSLKVDLKPVSFEFEGQPFMLKADLNNFDNLRYNITSRGILPLGEIYKVFAIKGYNVNGFIKTNLALAGSQSDAVAGRYHLLHNKGTMQVKDVMVSAELFPLPFYIRNGLFRFDQDKVWFDQFKATYGKSDLILNGALSNVLGYATQNNQTLKGSFDVKCDYILVDELMVNGGDAGTTMSTAPGVVMVPANLSLVLNAAARKVHFNGINIQNFQGQVALDSNKIKLGKTGFTIIGAPVEMEAMYTSVSPRKAAFDYRISAAEFDIKRAYNEIKLFHDLASSAASASGIVGLNYQLSGRLDENMNPVYPSLKGGGELTLKKIKLKGFRLFNSVSKSTGKESMSDPDLSKVTIKTTINKNIITINRTKMRISGLHPRFEGQVSFDGRLNLKGRVGLPPFGLFGIPFNVTGTQEKPVVKLKRGKNGELLEEKDDEEPEEGTAQQ